MEDELVRIKREKMERMLEKAEGGDSMETKVEANDGNFEQVVIERSKKVPVVVDFWALWCQPCLMLGPILEKLAGEYKGKFVLAKVDVSRNQEKAQKYGIMSIPAVKLFKEGKVADEFVGAIPEPAVRQWLDKNLG
jgi:putative thioredoxin